MKQADPGSGVKVFVDATILERVDSVRPEYLSRTGFINTLIDIAVSDWARRQKGPLRGADGPIPMAYIDPSQSASVTG